MIFRQWDLILAALKTVTRRLVKPGDYGIGLDGTVYPDLEKAQGIPLKAVYSDKRRKRFAVGQKLPIIPKRGERAIRDENGLIRRVEVTALRAERLHSIPESDAVQEGVADVAAYMLLWSQINHASGKRWADNPLVIVITFELVWEQT